MGRPSSADAERRSTRQGLGLQSARRDRLELISERTEYLLRRINAAVNLANSKVLFNPKQSPAVVSSSNQVANGVFEFHELLGIASGRATSEARRWREAAQESWDEARATGERGAKEVKRLGGEAAGWAAAARVRISAMNAERKRQSPGDE